MILAFDPGEKTGYACYNTKTKDLSYGLIKEKDTLQYMEQIGEVYQNNLPSVVLIEQPFVKFLSAAMSLARCTERIKIAVLLQFPDALIVDVPNLTWKKAIIGKGKVKKGKSFVISKDQTKKFVNQKFGLNLTDDNITDAIAISLYGEKLMEKCQERT